MIIHRGTRLRHVFKRYVLANWRVFALVVAIQLGIDIFHPYLGHLEIRVLSGEAVAMLATVVGIFLVFRVNEAYQRWWEARTQWGSLVNASRGFGRKVVTLLTADGVKGLPDADAAARVQRQLAMRHVAFVNALRMRLRGESERLGTLAEFLDDDELDAVQGASNAPLELLRRQSAALRAVLDNDTPEQLVLLNLQAMLDRFDDVQGACERIKFTTFPDRVAYMSTVFTWSIAAMISLLFLQPREGIYPPGFTTVFLIALSFFIVEQLGVELKNPFENRPNDTPMTALCRTIERDLREQLGDRELPPPVEARDGVLM